MGNTKKSEPKFSSTEATAYDLIRICELLPNGNYRLVAEVKYATQFIGEGQLTKEQATTYAEQIVNALNKNA